MKKRISVSVLALILAVTLFLSGCSATLGKETVTESPHDSDSSFKVAVIQYDNDEFTSQLRQTFIKRMRLLGYDEAKMKFDIKNAQASESKLTSCIDSLKDSKYDLIIVIGDKAAQVLSQAGSSVPAVFIGVSDPVYLGLTSSLDAPDRNMTGSVNNSSNEDVLSFIRILTPNVSKVAVVCMNNEKSLSEKESVKEYLTEEIFEVEEAVLESVDSASETLHQLLSRNDALYITADTELLSVSKQATEIATANGKYIYSSNTASVEYGVLASSGCSIQNLSYSAASCADSILRGVSVSAVPIVADSETQIYISSSTATALGVEIPKISNIIRF